MIRILERCWAFVTKNWLPSVCSVAFLIITVIGLFTRHFWYRLFDNAALWVGAHDIALDIILGFVIVVFFPFLSAAYAIHISKDASRATKVKVWAIFGAGLIMGGIWVVRSVYEQSKKDSELISSNQTIKNTLGAISLGLNSLTATKPLTLAEQEEQRRQRMLSLLRAQYVAARRSVDPGLISGTKEPPKDWINEQLKNMGESWTVEETLGTSAPPQPLRESLGTEPFKNFTDTQLAEWINEEIQKVSNLLTGTQNRYSLMVSPTPDQASKRSMEEMIDADFTNKFLACCLKDMTDLRTEIQLRLGPRAKMSDEEEEWDRINREVKTLNKYGEPTVHFGDVAGYLPYLHSYELNLRERAAPRTNAATNAATKFKWQVAATPSPTGAKFYLVTAWPNRPITRGFILVDYVAPPIMTVPEPMMNEPLQPHLRPDAGPRPEEEVDNQELMSYWTPRRQTALVLELDNQPITPTQPLVLKVYLSTEPKIREIKAF
jgi:hypothetical protein